MPLYHHGSGGPVVGQAILDFGAAYTVAGSIAIVGQSKIVADSIIVVSVALASTADHSTDEHLSEALKVYPGNIIPGTGFTIYGLSQLGGTWGKWAVNWNWT